VGNVWGAHTRICLAGDEGPCFSLSPDSQEGGGPKENAGLISPLLTNANAFTIGEENLQEGEPWIW
jgi:hypothetical protein